MAITKRWWPYSEFPGQQRVEDMHQLVIPNDSQGYGEPVHGLQDYSCTSESGEVRLVMRDLENRLVDEIKAAEFVIGCVAWLTSEPILDALAGVGSQIIVQKEDFLRPDLDPDNAWKQNLRAAYERLRNPLERHQFPSPLGHTSVCSDPTIDPVRCVGNHNRARKAAMPRSHHKFVVFCRYWSDDGDDHAGLKPYAVWTGSFNFTKNATRSFENALILTDPAIVSAFVHEYAQIAALSEPLDWETDWAAPEWRIGT